MNRPPNVYVAGPTVNECAADVCKNGPLGMWDVLTSFIKVSDFSLAHMHSSNSFRIPKNKTTTIFGPKYTP